MLNAAIISAIEDFAPARYQESWDNTGVQVGSLRAECTGVLLCVDVTPQIVDEAHSLGCSLIVSHHPLLFKGLKRISGNTPAEESVARAIKRDICIYSCHTAVDSTHGGVSYRMAEMLGAKVQRVLSPLKGLTLSADIIVSGDDAADVVALACDHSAGQEPVTTNELSATTVGNVSDDPFSTSEINTDRCVKVSAIIAAASVNSLHDSLVQRVGNRLKSFTVQSIDNCDNSIGLGVLAIMNDNINARQLIERVKTTFGSPVVRCTALPDDDIAIRRVAMCGGSGSEFISSALRMGAQAIITSDTKYHDFVDYQNDILIVDIGHFESEKCTKQIFYDAISKKFPNFACYKSQIEDNPIKYI